MHLSLIYIFPKITQDQPDEENSKCDIQFKDIPVMTIIRIFQRMSQAEELRHQASSSSHEVDQDQDQEEVFGIKTLQRLLSTQKKLFSKHMVTLKIMRF